MATQFQQWKKFIAANLVLVANQRSDYADQVRTFAQGPLAVANESVVYPVDGESTKLRVYIGTSGGTVEAMLHGWSFSEEDGVWMPEILGKATGTAHTVSRVIGGTALFPIISWTIDAGSGNLRTVPGSGLKVAASLLADHQGSQWLEVAFRAAAIMQVNGFRKNV